MIRKILVIRFSSLGDIILTSATITNLRINYPRAEICFLTKEQYRAAVEMIDSIDKIYCPSSNKSYYQFLLELDKENFDIVVDLHGSMRSWLARKIISVGQTVVYPKRRLERFRIVKQKKIPIEFPHTIDLYNDTLLQLNQKAYCQRPVINVNSLKSTSNSITVVIAPGAAHKTKKYPIENFKKVAEKLKSDLSAKIIWMITNEDAGIGSKEDIEYLNLSIDEVASCIAQSDLSITNDSGIAHLSSAVGTPNIAVFGPTHPSLGFAPKGLHDVTVEVDESCRPCSRHGKKECYRKEQFCFTRITPGMIFGQAKEIIGQQFRKNKAVFIDRDGTIIIDKHFLKNPDEIEFIDGAIEALKILQSLDYKIVIISNQSGVARGYFDIQTVEVINARLLEMLNQRGVDIAGIYYCPHYRNGSSFEFSIDCDCRKPMPGMVEEAARQLQLDLRQSLIIGDKTDDFNLGQVIGAKSFLVLSGHGQNHKKNISKNSSGFIYNDILQAVQSLKN